MPEFTFPCLASIVKDATASDYQTVSVIFFTAAFLLVLGAGFTIYLERDQGGSEGPLFILELLLNNLFVKTLAPVVKAAGAKEAKEAKNPNLGLLGKRPPREIVRYDLAVERPLLAIAPRPLDAAMKFNPVIHLAPHVHPFVHTMESLGLGSIGISSTGISETFELFTQEAVTLMRDEVFQEDVWKHCSYSSSRSAYQIRGIAPKYAKFVFDAWTHPETLRRISEVAGINLIPNMNCEIGHVNISGLSEKADKPVVHWHKDAYPFVCVLMLSDASTMEGGETALKTGSGEIMKVRGPKMGWATVLQGRFIEHIALPTLNCQERITMVTSFRPKDPAVVDDSTLLAIRPVSNLQDLYNQWADYRIEIIKDRCELFLEKLRNDKLAGRSFDMDGIKSSIREMANFLETTAKEIIPGRISEVDNCDEETKAAVPNVAASKDSEKHTLLAMFEKI